MIADMKRRILIIQAHPDPRPERYCQALAAAYRAGAESAGHQVETLTVAELDFKLLRSEAEWKEAPAPDIQCAQEAIAAADHLVFVFPLWMGTMPALLKAFLEQVLRPGFAFDDQAREGFGGKRLQGKSARAVVTMGMPGPVYRWFFGAHGYLYFKRNILKFCGIKPVRHCFAGLAAAKDGKGRQRWLQRVEKLGRDAS